MGLGSSIVTTMAQVAALARVWSLAQELPHAAGAGEKKKRENHIRVPVMAQWLTTPTSIHDDMGSISGIAQCSKDLVLP